MKIESKNDVLKEWEQMRGGNRKQNHEQGQDRDGSRRRKRRLGEDEDEDGDEDEDEDGEMIIMIMIMTSRRTEVTEYVKDPNSLPQSSISVRACSLMV